MTATRATDTPATPLDKRRAKWLATVSAATAAQGALAVLDGELEATVLKREAGKAELDAAVDRTTELEKEIKALAKQRKRLRAERAKAESAARKSRGRVKVAEKRFDRALIKDMLRKAKSEALAADTVAPSRPRAATKAAPRRRTPSTNGRTPRA